MNGQLPPFGEMGLKCLQKRSLPWDRTTINTAKMIPQPRVVSKELGRLLAAGAKAIFAEVKIVREKAIE